MSEENNVVKQKITKYSYAVMKKGEEPKIGDEWKYDSLKDALNAFLMEEKYSAVKDSKLFYVKNEDQVYVGFSRDGIDDHVALFFRLETEVTTTSSIHDIKLDEVESLFK